MHFGVESAYDEIRNIFDKWLNFSIYISKNNTAQSIIKATKIDNIALEENRETILNLLDELDTLLSKNMFNAITHFKKLQTMLINHPAAPYFTNLEKLINDMEFDVAREQLTQLRFSLGWSRS